MAGGRPTAYRKEYVDIVFRLALLNIDEKRMAGVFNVTEKTFNAWKKRYPEFLQSLRDGRDNADSKVAKSLFERAMGYTCKETKVFCYQGEIVTVDVEKHYPPDPSSMIFYLKNKQRALWKDRRNEEDDDDREKLAEALRGVLKDMGENLPG